ncbi:hypothetical protein AAFF_G00100860 [Aldrovandia affinis]|uniref:Uncharacterized protein n=1 Tax=Aldrovandia affinis TaxID=143900 RepID=A0AAD7RUM1_9TELE|nr:hypothetical protein AAFF_G00100860 [Aldrovandia affinis]
MYGMRAAIKAFPIAHAVPTVNAWVEDKRHASQCQSDGQTWGCLSSLSLPLFLSPHGHDPSSQAGRLPATVSRNTGAVGGRLLELAQAHGHIGAGDARDRAEDDSTLPRFPPFQYPPVSVA